MITPYQFAINNTKAFLRGDENRRLVEKGDPEALDAFKAAKVLAAAFMKDRNEVLAALIAQ
jgi:hypothetical protein